VRASDWEFRQRFWIFGLIFGAGFFCYTFDHVNFGGMVADWLQPHLRWPETAIARLVFGIGALITVLACSLRTWASSYLHTTVVHDHALHSDRLVADGPYRIVRNPLYLGNTLMAIGVGFMASRLGIGVLVSLILVFNYRLILREENELLETQGESYREYLRRVPRMFPAISPRIPASPNRPQWAQAFVGEAFFWIFALASVCFAATLKFRYWWLTMVVAIPLYFVGNALVKRRSVPVS
jgi:protein-S-isoprenylcysteine O-methyltransferase Ste14